MFYSLTSFDREFLTNCNFCIKLVCVPSILPLYASNIKVSFRFMTNKYIINIITFVQNK